MVEEVNEQEPRNPGLVYYDKFTSLIRDGVPPGEAHLHAIYAKNLLCPPLSNFTQDESYSFALQQVNDTFRVSKFKTWAAMALLVLTLMLVGWAGTNSPHIIVELIIFIVGIGWTIVFYSLLKKQTWWLTHAKEDFWNLPDTLKATEP